MSEVASAGRNRAQPSRRRSPSAMPRPAGRRARTSMSGNKRQAMVIQPRDEQLLREIAVMRIIDREHAKAVAGFGSTRRVNARLLALYREGLLRRFFQGTKAGGQKALYALSSKAARLIGASHREFRYANDELLATNFFVAHQLAVNRIYCSVKAGCALQPNVRFIRWVA